jgi:hypothetical protein
MSLANLIMANNQQNANYGIQMANDLSAFGQTVVKGMKDARDSQTAQSMLPVMQQAMKSFGEGKSAEGYSTLLTLSAADPSNPYLDKLVKVGLIGGQAVDDNRYKTALAGAKTSGMESILPILMLTNPELAKKLSGSLGKTTQTDATQATEMQATETQTENTDNASPKLDKNGVPIIETTLPMEEVNSIINPSGDSGKTETPPESQTVAETRNAINTNSKQLYQNGTTYGQVVANVDDMVFTPETLGKLKPELRNIAGLDKYIPGVRGVAIIPEDAFKNKTLSINSRSGATASFANDPQYQKDPAKFLEAITEAIATLDSDEGIQEAIKLRKGIKNISFVPGTGTQSKIANLPKGKTIKINEASKKALNLISALPQAAKNAQSPLFGDGIDIPPPSNKSKEELANILR